MGKDEDDERTYLLENGQSTSKQQDDRLQLDDKRLGYFAKKKRMKMLRKYYEEQDRLIELYEQDAELLSKLNTQQIRQQAKEEKEEQLVWDKRFASIVFVVNVLIFGGNLTASILSGSYSVISAFIDSSMDIMSRALFLIFGLTLIAINERKKLIAISANRD